MNLSVEDLDYAYRIARRFCQGRADDEYASEAHYALLLAYRTHDPARGPLRPFARRAVVSALINLRRAASRRRAVPDSAATEAAQAPAGLSPGVLAAALARIEAGAGLARLHWLDGVPRRELAERFGVTEHAIRRQLAETKSDVLRILEGAF